MPITINGVPLVVAGQVNRQAIAAVVHDGGHQSYYRLHPQAFASAIARDSPAPAHADLEIALAARVGLRR